MAKLTTTTLANLQNEVTAVNTINNNFAATITAMENTLSRDGTSPNSMGANLDMNSNRILNLVAAVGDTEPIRKAEFDVLEADVADTLSAAVAVATAAAAASAAAALVSENNAATHETNAETAETNAETAATNAATSEANALAYAARYKGTSTTSVAIGTGSKSFTTQASKNFDVGVWLLITSDANPANYMHGQVTAYSGTSLTVNVTNTGGSGTLADWTITVAGTRGAVGATGDPTDFSALTDAASVAADYLLFSDVSDSNIVKKDIISDVVLAGLPASPQFTTVELGHASDTTLSRTGAGAIAVEGVGVPLNSITDTHTCLQLEVGHASDTTISRDSAGVISVEGSPLFPNLPQNSQSAAYTLVLSDAGKHILHPTADNNARTFTIPANASVAYPIGTVVTFINQINTVTISITTDTLTMAGTGSTGSRTLAANGMATAVKIASTSWIISGPGLS